MFRCRQIDRQMPLFVQPRQPRRAGAMADDVYAKILELRRSSVPIRAEGLNIVVSGTRLTVREFRRVYLVAH